jgi:hypothetical protein
MKYCLELMFSYWLVLAHTVFVCKCFIQDALRIFLVYFVWRITICALILTRPKAALATRGTHYINGRYVNSYIHSDRHQNLPSLLKHMNSQGSTENHTCIH